MRDAFDCYALFKKHPAAFESAATFTEFYTAAGLDYLERYAGGWVESAFETAKAGKATRRPLIFPRAAKFADLFTAAFFLQTDSKSIPRGACFMSGRPTSRKEGDFAPAPCGHMGGTRGYSERTPGTRSHYGTKFYGSYVVPSDEVRGACESYFGKNQSFSFEAIAREDGVLIIARWPYPGEMWLALLDQGETVEALFDDETRAFITKEKQAAVDAWGAE